MKKTIYFLTPLLTLGMVFAQDAVKEVPVTIGKTDGSNPQGFIQNSNDQAILFSPNAGQRGGSIPYTQIRGEGLDKLIRFDERAEVLAEARAVFSNGDYNAAANAFGQIARNYAIILGVPQNFASEAFFYQLESLKRAGKYGALSELAESAAGKTIETKLGAEYQRPFEFIKLWGLLGANRMEDLKSALGKYQQPVTGDAKLLPAPNFVDMPVSDLAQIAYLRAKVYDAEGNKNNALDDYYRAFTLASGNDPLLSKLAMGAAMVIQKEDPRLAKEDDDAVSQMQSLAYVFAKRFGKEIMPEEIRRYAERPPMPEFRPAPPAEESEPAAAAEAETSDEGGEKAKGKGKAADKEGEKE